MPLPRYRHIARLANCHLGRGANKNTIRYLLRDRAPRGYPDVAEIWSNGAILQCIRGIYATIANYLESELRYMDAGDEAQQRQQGQ
jgi:hypothetical protein